MGVQETVAELLEPVVETLEVDILDVEWNGNSLRITVDRLLAEGEVHDRTNGVTSDQLAQVNRLISPILDQHDPVPGRYTLEVTSPGVERKLARPEHFVRALGEEVVIKMHPTLEPRRLKGELLSCDAEAGTIIVLAREIDGIDQKQTTEHVVDLADISKARTSFEWGPGPKPGQPGAKKGQGGKKPHPKQAQQNKQPNREEKDPT